MRVVIVSCVFPPEPVVSSRTSFDVARELAARGHDVTVIAPFPNRPAGRIYAGYRRVPFGREIAQEGFRVVRCASLFSRRSSLLSRLAENISFGITSSVALLVHRKPAVIYANTWPIFAAGLTALVSRLRRIPLVISVQDLYPESLTSQRRPGSGLMARVMMALDRWIVRGAAAVVAISDRFAEHYRRTRRIEASRLHVVRNWLPSANAEAPAGAGDACRARHGIRRDAFLLVYGGNVGVSASVETVVEAFRHLDEAPEDFHLLVAGEGASLDHCMRLAVKLAPRRVHFEHPWTDTSGVLSAADAFVLPTRAAQSAASVPSKLISYLLAERPVIAAALSDSETAAVVDASGAGVVVEPDDPTVLAEAITAMARRPADERRRMGRAGRVWAMANVTSEICLPRLIAIVEEAAQ